MLAQLNPSQVGHNAASHTFILIRDDGVAWLCELLANNPRIHLHTNESINSGI